MSQTELVADDVKISKAFKDLIPPLSEEELAQLEQNLKDEGCRDPLVVWKEERTLLDGHNRYRLCKKHGISFKIVAKSFPDETAAKIWMVQNQFGRRNLSAYTRSELALELESLFQEKAKQNQVRKPGSVCQVSDEQKVDTKKELAKIARVSHDTIAKTKVIKARADDETKKALREGKQTINAAYRDIKRKDKAEKQETERAANRAIVQVADKPEELTGLFSTIVIDPPWDFTEEGDDDVYGRTKPRYAQMKEAELASLKVGDRAAKDAHLYLWITNRSLMTGKGWRLCEAWGFRPVTLLTWCKPSIGVGNYFRNSTEHIIFAVKGSLTLANKSTGTWFEWGSARRKHSAKPVESYDLIESCSPGPYLEMFARSHRDGWVSWGAEA